MQEPYKYQPEDQTIPLPDLDFENQTVEKFKSIATQRAGTSPPDDPVKNEQWLRDNSDGTFTTMLWNGSSWVEHYTTNCKQPATDEQMQSLTPEQLAFYSANAGQVKNVENNRADLTLSNVEEVSDEFQVLLGAFTGVDPLIDYYPKTEAEKAEANGNWWRKYKSGWIEQGGVIEAGSRINLQVNLHIPFINSNYSCSKNLEYSDAVNPAVWSFIDIFQKTNTSFYTARYDTKATWEAKGF